MKLDKLEIELLEKFLLFDKYVSKNLNKIFKLEKLKLDIFDELACA